MNLGDTNFEDGFAAQGWFLEEFPSGYTAGQLKDSNGKTVTGSNRVTAYSTTSHVARSAKNSIQKRSDTNAHRAPHLEIKHS
jgi:hypothetical protein